MAILETPLFKLLICKLVFSNTLNDGELQVKFVSYVVLFTIQQEIIQVMEQTPLKEIWDTVSCCPKNEGIVTCG
jgi:hypothetical protein